MEQCAYCARDTASPTCAICGFPTAGAPILVYARLVPMFTSADAANADLDAFATLGVVLARGDDDILVLSTATVVDFHRALSSRQPRARAAVQVVLLANPAGAPFAAVPDADFAHNWLNERAVRRQTTAWLSVAEKVVLELAPAGGVFGVEHAAALLGVRRDATIPPTTITTRDQRLTLVTFAVADDGAIVGSLSIAPDPLRRPRTLEEPREAARSSDPLQPFASTTPAAAVVGTTSYHVEPPLAWSWNDAAGVLRPLGNVTQMDATRDALRRDIVPAAEAAEWVDAQLVTSFPLRVARGDVVTLECHVEFARLPPPAVPIPVKPGTTVVRVTHHRSAGLECVSDNELLLPIPAAGDPPAGRFAFRAVADGPQSVSVTAYLGALRIGGVDHQVTVADVTAAPTEYRAARSRPRIAGEVTLEVAVERRGQMYRYTYRWIDGALIPRPAFVLELAESPHDIVAGVLTGIAPLAATSPGPAGARRKLQEAGARLWSKVIPPDARDLFSAAGTLTGLIVVTSGEGTQEIPWELLYPHHPASSHPFIGEQVRLGRWLHGVDLADAVETSSACLISPSGSPSTAAHELDMVETMLVGMSDVTRVEDRDAVKQRFDTGGLGIVHFACHGTFRRATLHFGSRSLDHDIVSNATSPSARAVMVVNAATTDPAGDATDLARWAQASIGRGYGAVLGPQWCVPPRAATAFARTFYTQLLGGNSLGDAVRVARDAARSYAGDAASLAYVLYGDPAASA
jgi:hypothetical protein